MTEMPETTKSREGCSIRESPLPLPRGQLSLLQLGLGCVSLNSCLWLKLGSRHRDSFIQWSGERIKCFWGTMHDEISGCIVYFKVLSKDIQEQW